MHHFLEIARTPSLIGLRTFCSKCLIRASAARFRYCALEDDATSPHPINQRIIYNQGKPLVTVGLSIHTMGVINVQTMFALTYSHDFEFGTVCTFRKSTCIIKRRTTMPLCSYNALNYSSE